MIDCEKLQDYICELYSIVDCEITVGEIKASTETTCKGFCAFKLVYDSITAGKRDYETCVYSWSIDTAVVESLNAIALKVPNLTVEMYLRAIAAGIICEGGCCNE